MTPAFLGILVACVAGAMSGNVCACQKFPLITPAKFETLAERRPTLVWQGDASLRYRVQVAALLPEARIVLSLDTEVTGNRFPLPVALPLERAAIKVLVSSGCDGLDAQDLHAQGAWFFVDVRSACAMDEASLKQTPARLSWSGVHGAGRYSVRLFEAAGPRDEFLNPVQQAESSEPRWVFPAEVVQSRHSGVQRVATVQAICDGQPGRPVSLPLAR